MRATEEIEQSNLFVATSTDAERIWSAVSGGEYRLPFMLRKGRTPLRKSHFPTVIHALARTRVHGNSGI